MQGRRRGERGAVTAETAMAMPLLAAVTVGLVWVVAVAGAQTRTVDAAREAARMVARGDTDAAAVEVASRVAPEGARVEIRRAAGRVEVTVAADVTGPGGVFSTTGQRVSARSVAVIEPGVEGADDAPAGGAQGAGGGGDS